MSETTRPLRVAVVGSGPSGFYAAEALFKLDSQVEVDMFERLPTPYGLVRGGVAPDHQSIKNVSKVYAKTAQRADFRFFGNVTIGRDLTVSELCEHYDRVIFAVGNESDRRLGIANEGIVRCTPAAVFVGWYNGHPDYRDATFDWTKERVAVVGNGNVAIDVARILAKTADELASTDIAEHALAALAESRIEEIVLLGRRGPVQAAFTPAELKELGKLEGAVPIVRKEDLQLDAISAAELETAPKQTKRNLEILQQFSERAPEPEKRRLELRFFVSPLEVLTAEDGGVGGLLLGQNSLVAREGGGSKAVLGQTRETLDIDLLLPAIGFTGEPLAGVPFDEARGTIRNLDGRVVREDRSPVLGQYVVGWAKSGPRGLIGAHKKASAQVVDQMIADLGATPERSLPDRDAIKAVLEQRQIKVVSFDDWQRIDEVETERGKRRGAPRVKLTDVDEMLEVASD
jgi:ferredoxin--NADP+ reductase